MPLIFMKENESTVIKKIGGNKVTRLHLEKLGFVAGSTITVITHFSGNLIVNIKDTRIALSSELASKILV